MRKVRRIQQRTTQENDFIERMGENLSMMAIEVMYTNFGFTMAKLNNFCKFTWDEKMRWLKDETDTNVLLDYALKDNDYIRDAVKRTPFSQMVAVSGMKRPPVTPDARKLIEAGMSLCFVWIDSTLKDHYRLNRECREAFFKLMTWQNYNPDEEPSDTNFRSCFVLWADKKQPYGREWIRKKFITEQHYDIVKGDPV